MREFNVIMLKKKHTDRYERSQYRKKLNFSALEGKGTETLTTVTS